MSAIEDLLRQPAAQAVGWALVHFIWQGSLVGLGTAATLACVRKSAADVRYVIATIGLSVMLTLPAVTATQLWRSANVTDLIPLDSTPARLLASSARDSRGVARRTAVDTTFSRPSVPRLDSLRVEPWLPLLVLGWLLGVSALSLRLLSGWLWVQRMKSHGTKPVSAACQHLALRLSRRLHIARHVQLLESVLVEVPTVIGWMKPVVLLPASALSGLNPDQIAAVLAHELAHIRRHDYLVNLLQTAVETLLFYHPAVWWLSRRIREERENCCDDLAVSLCGDPYTYATALAELEGLRGSGRFAIAASGGSLVHRVKRLIGAPQHAGRAPGWLAASAALVVLAGVGTGVVGGEAFQEEPSVRAAVDPATTAASQGGVNVASTAGARRPVGPANSLRTSAVLYATTAHAVAALEAVTGNASTPFMASAPLAAQAAAFARAAQPTGGSAAATIAVQSHGTFSWSNNGEQLEVRYDGEVEFTDDDLDVKRLSPGGQLRIRDGGMMTSLLGGHTVEFTADASGNISRRYWIGTSERPFEPEGRRWLSSVLPRFIRQTGIGAAARVARIFKAKGTPGVLAEISLVEGSWAKRKYFSELLKMGSLDPSSIRQVLAQAGREMDSDYELATLLIENASALLVDEGSRQAYVDASRSIGSDYEMHRAYSAVVKRAPVNPALLVSLLGASRNIDSDFEEASLLVEVASLHGLDSATRAAFFGALDTVQSDYEHGRVLKTLAARGDLSPETTGAMLASGVGVKSDYEAATFLLTVLKQQSIEGSLRAPFFRAVESIKSGFERGRVLQAAAKRPDASPETVLGIIHATAGMGSSFEASQVLLALSSSHAIEGPARDAYVDAAGKFGDYEQGRVLAALVKSERRK